MSLDQVLTDPCFPFKLPSLGAESKVYRKARTNLILVIARFSSFEEHDLGMDEEEIKGLIYREVPIPFLSLISIVQKQATNQPVNLVFMKDVGLKETEGFCFCRGQDTLEHGRANLSLMPTCLNPEPEGTALGRRSHACLEEESLHA